ncbi:hypothetical protein CH29_gp31 [Achromobacter phage JWAlpha]|uniref:Uncharacterized protein n=1 Tax=Achromobacter phage JWAlpha TaxID=1416009 RepID=V9VEG8_9CAUD|nr:hypothetical protein CH29_gp31 [Achromobacter phage JWAlpha]AHC93984.1 hypothetical protein JJJB_0031 [Achromobacter phage JWAlpha]
MNSAQLQIELQQAMNQLSKKLRSGATSEDAYLAASTVADVARKLKNAVGAEVVAYQQAMKR